MRDLTPKQKNFAQCVASGMTQTEAYNSVYSVERMKAKTIQEAASRLMAKSNILAMIKELREPIIKKVGITLENHLRELKSLRVAAKKDKQYGAAIKAEMARGKVCGLYDFADTDNLDEPLPLKVTIERQDGRK